MVIEIATFHVADGRATEFEQAYARARSNLLESPGCRSVRMTRGIETPLDYVLIVEWETLADHLETFRGSERYTRWRATIGEYFTSAEVHHTEDL